MASSASAAGAQQTPTRHRSRWALDFNSSRAGNRGGSEVTAAPVGYYSLGNQQVKLINIKNSKYNGFGPA